MKIKCINIKSGLKLGEIYEVVINQTGGYELHNDMTRIILN